MSVNSAHIVGYLGQDPRTNTLPSGDTVTNVSVATSERWEDKAGERQERTTWWSVSFWGRLGEIASEYLHKGSLVYVEGSVSARAYVSRSGEAAASLELRASVLKMLGGRDDREDSDPAPRAAPASTRAPAPKPAAAPAAAPVVADFDDDIPF